MIRNIRELVTFISPELSIRLLYLYYFKKFLNLKNPKTLDEKIQWMKLNLYSKDPIYTECADKYAVRKYVKEVGCSEILNELLYVYESVDDIDWSSLPNKFAIKWNYGNGFNIICKDKSKFDINAAIAQMKEWQKRDSWLRTAEMQYKNIPKKIIIEKYIDDGNPHGPIDYKIYCFHGEPKYLFACVGRELGKPKFYFFDREWNLARINPDSINAPEGFTIPKPAHLEKMFEYAAKLSSRFPFVRVDFYDTDKQIYFGELTFTPGGGFDTSRLSSTQILLGNLLDLKK